MENFPVVQQKQEIGNCWTNSDEVILHPSLPEVRGQLEVGLRGCRGRGGGGIWMFEWIIFFSFLN